MTILLLNLALAAINLLSRVARLRCFSCGKKLRLRVVKRGGEASIECECCWRIAAEKGGETP